MKDLLSKLDKCLQSAVRTIGLYADEKGVRAYVVGGIVRDIILSRPSLDLDIVVEADATRFVRGLARFMNAEVVTHPQFKTASLKTEHLLIDFATARAEDYASPGALPKVKSGTLRDDLYRRDFTINAVAVSINKNTWGEIVDPFEGRKDIEDKRVRVLHDESFKDDPTRILRAVRFEQRFGFKCERNTENLLKEALKEDYPQTVKLPRYFAEFKKILKEKHPELNIKRLKELGGFGFLDAALQPDIKIQKILKDNLNHEKVQNCPWTVFLMGVLFNHKQALQEKVIGELPLTRQEQKSMTQAVAAQECLKALAQKGLKSSAVFELLHSLNEDVIIFLRLLARDRGIRQRIKRYMEKDAHTRLRVSPQEIKAIGGFPEKELGAVLKELLYCKIDKDLKTKQQEMNEARMIIAADGFDNNQENHREHRG